MKPVPNPLPTYNQSLIRSRYTTRPSHGIQLVLLMVSNRSFSWHSARTSHGIQPALLMVSNPSYSRFPALLLIVIQFVLPLAIQPALFPCIKYIQEFYIHPSFLRVTNISWSPQSNPYYLIAWNILISPISTCPISLYQIYHGVLYPLILSLCIKYILESLFNPSYLLVSNISRSPISTRPISFYQIYPGVLYPTRPISLYPIYPGVLYPTHSFSLY